MECIQQQFFYFCWVTGSLECQWTCSELRKWQFLGSFDEPNGQRHLQYAVIWEP
jgi:hypothetical protein